MQRAIGPPAMVHEHQPARSRYLLVRDLDDYAIEVDRGTAGSFFWSVSMASAIAA